MALFIIGSGLSGLVTALSVASEENRVFLVAREEPFSCASAYAQGGIAAVSSAQSEDVQLHINDTMSAGATHNDLAAVRTIIEQGACAIEWLKAHNVSFDRKPDGSYDLAREGGHSANRIFHIADHTGISVVKQLWQAVCDNPYISWIPADLYHLEHQAGSFQIFLSNGEIWETRQLVLATGGYSGLYPYATCPRSLGLGLGMAISIGAAVSDLAFVQFHPTVFFPSSQAAPLLLTEALRGEGAYLRDINGKRFMLAVDARGELATRDIVSAALYKTRKTTKQNVFLDLRHLCAQRMRQRFPTLDRKLRTYGFDLCADLIPVQPAAHYTCGGIVVDSACRSSIPGLYAVGEVSCTGLHGACRLASNSLLECIVSGRAAARSIRMDRVCDAQKKGTFMPVYSQEFNAILARLRQIAWHHLGLLRDFSRVEEASAQLHILQKRVTDLRAQQLISLLQAMITNIRQYPKSIGVHQVAAVETYKTTDFSLSS